MTKTTERIRVLNDQLRANGTGGRRVMTDGIASLSIEAITAIMDAVQCFEDFTPDNDPHREHDFALIEAADQRVMFKIDYYDLAMNGHSSDPSDPTVTTRVLTIMLADEY